MIACGNRYPDRPTLATGYNELPVCSVSVHELTCLQFSALGLYPGDKHLALP